MSRKIPFVLSVALIPVILYLVYYVKNLAEPTHLLFIVPSCIGIGVIYIIFWILHDYRIGKQNPGKLKDITFYFSTLCAATFIIACSDQSLSGFATHRPGSPFAMVNFIFMPIYLIPILLISYCAGWLIEWAFIKKNDRTVKSIYFPIIVFFAIILFVSGQKLIQYNPNLMHYNPTYFFSPPSIHYAAQEGNIYHVEKLIKKGVSVNLPKADSYKSTPLHYAALCGQDKMIEFLVSHGAEINARDASLHTPLHKACQTGYLNSVETLVRLGAVVDSQSQVGNTPLYEAARKGHVEIVSFLIGSTPKKLVNLSGTSLLNL
jgi:hypothetical protein